MCQIKKMFKPGYHPVTGYKVAILRQGKLYSPATGVEYKLGKVQAVGVNDCRRSSEFFVSNVVRDCPQPKMRGLTGVFRYQKHAESLLNGIASAFAEGQVVLLEMKIGDVQARGSYNMFPIYLGSVIRSMKILKRKRISIG